MTERSLIFLRVLGTAHFAVAIILLPVSLAVGLHTAPLFLPGQIWLFVLGRRLWRPDSRLRIALRNTHLVLGWFAIYLIAYGVLALRAAEESAKTGGGLLGAFGLIPIAMGLPAGCLSVVSLLVSYSATLKNLAGTEPKPPEDSVKASDSPPEAVV